MDAVEEKLSEEEEDDTFDRRPTLDLLDHSAYNVCDDSSDEDSWKLLKSGGKKRKLKRSKDIGKDKKRKVEAKKREEEEYSVALELGDDDILETKVLKKGLAGRRAPRQSEISL